MTKAIVCGGRDYTDAARVTRILEAAQERLGVDAIVQGGAEGVDRIAKEWAVHRHLQCDTYYAAWDLHGKAAGPIRNAEMLAKSEAEICFVFPGGKGTADMARRAEEAGLRVIYIDALEMAARSKGEN